jgi:TrmH family RNA methyltransferase
MPAPDEPLRSRSNPSYRRLVKLKERGSDTLCLLEGPKLLEEAMRAGVPIVEVAFSGRAETNDRAKPLLSELASRGVPLRRLEGSLLASLSEAETSQGLVALAERPRFSEEAIFAGRPLVVVAVGVQDPGNLGGLFRTAEAAGATGALLTEGTADPLSWKSLRGSMGSAFRLPHVRGLSASEAMRRLHARALRVVATAGTGGRAYTDFDWHGPVALLLGNEGAGLPESLHRSADAVVTIPLQGSVESLNVGVAAGLLLFEAARQRRAPIKE